MNIVERTFTDYRFQRLLDAFFSASWHSLFFHFDVACEYNFSSIAAAVVVAAAAANMPNSIWWFVSYSKFKTW